MSGTQGNPVSDWRSQTARNATYGAGGRAVGAQRRTSDNDDQRHIIPQRISPRSEGDLGGGGSSGSPLPAARSSRSSGSVNGQEFQSETRARQNQQRQQSTEQNSPPPSSQSPRQNPADQYNKSNDYSQSRTYDPSQQLSGKLSTAQSPRPYSNDSKSSHGVKEEGSLVSVDNGGGGGTWTEVTRGKNKSGHQRDQLERENLSHPVSTSSSSSTATPVVRSVPVKILPDPTPRLSRQPPKSPPRTGTIFDGFKKDYGMQLAAKQSKEQKKQFGAEPSQNEVWFHAQKVRDFVPHISVLEAERIVAERLRSGPVDIELLVNELLQKDEDSGTQNGNTRRLTIAPRSSGHDHEGATLVQKIRNVAPHISVLEAEQIVAERLRSGPVDIELLVNELLQKDEDSRPPNRDNRGFTAASNLLDHDHGGAAGGGEKHIPAGNTDRRPQDPPPDYQDLPPKGPAPPPPLPSRPPNSDVWTVPLQKTQQELDEEELQRVIQLSKDEYEQRENFAAGVMTGESVLAGRMQEADLPLRKVGERPGLMNLGNTCWFNSQTQILFYVPAYRNLLINSLPIDEWKPMAEDSLFIRFALLRRQLFARMLVAERTALNPMEVVGLSCRLSECQAGNQQDASEMLLHEFDWLEKAVRLGCSEEVSQTYYWQRYLQIEKDKVAEDMRNYGSALALSHGKKQLDDLAKKLDDLARQKPSPKFVAKMGDYLPNYVFEENSGPEFRRKELKRLFRRLVHHSTVEVTDNGEKQTDSSKKQTDSGKKQTDSGEERTDISWSPVFPLHIQSGNLMAALEHTWHDGPKRRTYVVDAPALMMCTLSRFDFNQDTGRTTKWNDPFHFPAKFRLTRFERKHQEQIEKILEKRDRNRSLLAVVECERNKLSTIPITNTSDVSSSKAATALVTFLEANEKSLTRGAKGESVANEHIRQLKNSLPWLQDEIQHRVKELDKEIGERKQLVNGAFDELEREFAQPSPYYHLYAIVVHMGEVTTGHYWALVRNRIPTKLIDIDEGGNQPEPNREDDWWWKFDDSQSTKIPWEQAMREALGDSSNPHAPSAYILCYARESELGWLFDEGKIPLEERLADGNDLLQNNNDGRLFKDSDHYKWLINALPADLRQLFKGDGEAASQNSRL